jgi:hypothetical protein
VGDRLPGVLAQQPVFGRGVSFLGMLLEVNHQRRGHRLPPLCPALFAQQDAALDRVEVNGP